MPGLVDTHVHVNDPGRSDWEGFSSATRAAAAGGITTLVDMPLNSIPPTCDVAALRLKQQTALPQIHVDVGFWGGAVPDNLGTLRELHDAGVLGFKCFLLHSGVDEFPHLDADQLGAAMDEIAAFDGLLIVHAEDAETIDHAPPAHGADYRTFLDSRPRQAENVAIGHVIAEAQRSGARTHILHLSSSDAIPMIRSAKQRRRTALGRDLPALSRPGRRGRPRRRDAVQVLPAHSRGRQPRPALGWAPCGRHRLRRLRPLAVNARPEATGLRRLRRRLGRDLLPPAGAVVGVDRGAPPGARPCRTSPGGWLRHLPTEPGCVRRDDSRSAPTRTSRSSLPTTSSPSMPRSCCTATRSAPTTATASPAGSGRPGCGESRSSAHEPPTPNRAGTY